MEEAEETDEVEGGVAETRGAAQCSHVDEIQGDQAQQIQPGLVPVPHPAPSPSFPANPPPLLSSPLPPHQLWRGAAMDIWFPTQLEAFPGPIAATFHGFLAR